MADVADRVALGYLLDFYGPLLTAHRRELVRLYCEARAQLEGYEEKLGLVARYVAINRQARACMAALDALGAGDGGAMTAARQALENILQIER